VIRSVKFVEEAACVVWCSEAVGGGGGGTIISKAIAPTMSRGRAMTTNES
jgi:hypothetical protein